MVAPPAYSPRPLPSPSLQIYPSAPPLLSPRSSPTSPVESHQSLSPMSAAEEKRALAEAEMAAQMQADLDRRRQKAEGGDEEHSRVKVLATVCFYLVAAIVMVFANKWVLNAVAIPLTFLFFQLVIAVLLLHFASMLGYFTLPTLTLTTARALSPLVGINVIGLVFNTYCLQYVDASFYQVARGLVLPFTVLASWAFLSSRPSSGVLVSVVIVCVGFFSGVSAEHLTVSALGVTLGVFSSMTTSVHAIVVKRSLGVASSPMDLAYYNNLLSALALIPPLALFSGEPRVLADLVAAGGEPMRTLVVGATITGVFGFLICIAGFLSIKVTSPVTHMISSAVRGVIQTLLGVVIFGDAVTWGRCTGIGFILLGSLGYTWVKDREAARAARERKEREDKQRDRDGSSSSSMDGLLSPRSAGAALGGSGYPSPVLLTVGTPHGGPGSPSPLRDMGDEKKVY